jgi:hypothetical protein
MSGQMFSIMEDNSNQNYNDIRRGAQKVSFTTENKVTDVGYFLRLAEFKTESPGMIGAVAIIVDRSGKVLYREPKSIRFIFD